MKPQPWYKDWLSSPYYNKLYAEQEGEQAESFIDQLVQYLVPAVDSFALDTACGQGQVCRKLSSLGFNTTGVDYTSNQVEYARQFESPKLSFFEHDMRLPLNGNYFHYAFNLFNRFGYFRSRREHDNFIRTTATSLRPGGVLVIDYFNAHYIKDKIPPAETKKIGQMQYDIHQWNDETYFYKNIKISDPVLPASVIYTEQYFRFSLGDFTEMLANQGLKVQEVFGDYQLAPYDLHNSPRLIIIAVKSDGKPGDKEKRLYSDGRRTDALT